MSCSFQMNTVVNKMISHRENRTPKIWRLCLTASDRKTVRHGQLFWANQLVNHPHTGWVFLFSSFKQEINLLLASGSLYSLQNKWNFSIAGIIETKSSTKSMGFIRIWFPPPPHTLTFKGRFQCYGRLCLSLSIPSLYNVFPVFWSRFVAIFDSFTPLIKSLTAKLNLNLCCILRGWQSSHFSLSFDLSRVIDWLI